MPLPKLIQGGMGAGVSGWRLARAVAREGELGVVSGTAIDTIFVRTLQNGDPGGHYRRAMEHFPFPEIVERVLGRFYIAGGKKADAPFMRLPMHTLHLTLEQIERITLANFLEVFLAKEDADGPVGINLLEKIQFPNLASIYGAMLAGVDYVLIGAGIPWQIPGAIDQFVKHEPATISANVEQAAAGEQHSMTFDPAILGKVKLPELTRPRFLAIISSATLATALVKRATGKIDGFIVEAPTAGGHNAPPRGVMKLNEIGEPVYGVRDVVDFAALRTIGLPFWIAGRCGHPLKLAEAQALGAVGVQVGTLFAFCEESGLAPSLKDQVLTAHHPQRVFTDPTASPTGFPFKVVELEGSLSDQEIYEERDRVCDLGYLRRAYRREDGAVGYRCPSEPVEEYVRKGGSAEDTIGRKCLCNALMANIGLEQVNSDGRRELPLVTAGDGLDEIEDFRREHGDVYTAREVVRYIRG